MQLRCWRLGITSYNPCLIFWMIFEEKYFSRYILLTSNFIAWLPLIFEVSGNMFSESSTLKTNKTPGYDEISSNVMKNCTGWNVSKYGVISGPHFPVFRLNTEIYEVNLCIQWEYRKMRTRNNSVFGHFSSSAALAN